MFHFLTEKIMKEYYETVMGAVCRLTGFTPAEVLHSRCEQATDARFLLLYFLSSKLTNGEITRLTGLSKQAVSQILIRYTDRKRFKFSLRCDEATIRKELDALTE